MKILIKIKYGNKIVKEINNRGQLLLEDNTILDRKNLDLIEIFCDSCNSISKWKSVPPREYLLKDKFLCKSCRQIGDKNSQFGKKWNEERRLKKSEEMIGSNNHMYKKSFYDVWVEKYGKDKAEELLNDHREKSKKVGNSNGMFVKNFYDVWLDKYGKEESDRRLTEFKSNKSKWINNNKEHHQKMIINSHIRKYRKTSIEKILENFLIQKNINYRYNFILDNKYQFDFYIKEKNIIIETHGDYWHANPIYYSNIDESKKKLNENQIYKISMDEIKKEYATKNGYHIIYLWETDIKNNNYKKILEDYGVC